jgi:type IV secretory pathway VirB4 component
MPVFREKDIHTPFIAGCLPMNTFQKLNAVHTRFKTMLFDDAALFFPLFGGVPPQKGARHWVSAQSTPTSFDLMGRGGNQTTIVLGASGGGKSCFMAQQIIEFLGRFPEGIVRIIDKRTSSEKIVDLFGGQLVKFTDASLRERPFSPFAIPTWTEDDIKTCVNGLLYAMTMLSPEASINSGHIEVLTDAVKNCGNKQIQEMKKSEHYHFTWSHVKQCLEDGARKLNIDVRYAHDLMNWGISFESHKSMGYIFDTQQKTIDKSLPKMVVFDLQGVQDAQTQNISAQIAFSKIISDIQRIPAKVPKLIIIEELGVVLSGDTPQTEEMANKQISNIVKTIRKLGGVPFGITNELDDFFSKKGGRSFWMQSTQKVFLPFTSQMNTSLLNHTQTFSEPDRELIASLHLNKKEKYSMAYIKQDEGFVGSIKIPLSPLMNAVITTDANEVSCYQDLRKNGMGVKETIEYMAEHHPYGAGL